MSIVVFATILCYLKLHRVTKADTTGKYPKIRKYSEEAFLTHRLHSMVQSKKVENCRIYSENVTLVDEMRFRQTAQTVMYKNLDDDSDFVGPDSEPEVEEDDED